MSISLHLSVFDRQQLTFSTDVGGAIDLGRQDDRGETPHSSRVLPSGVSRVVIAQSDEDTVSRHHAKLEPISEALVRLTNVSRKQTIGIPVGPPLLPGGTCELALPVLLTLGRKVVRVEATSFVEESLPEATAPPGRFRARPNDFSTIGSDSTCGLEVERIIGWLQAATDVVQSAAGSHDFFDRAARAMVELVSMDAGWVLLWEQGAWRTEALQLRSEDDTESTRKPIERALDRVREEKRTYWLAPGVATPSTQSIANLRTLIVAPILDAEGEVIGALYGDRRLDPAAPFSARITRMEAKLVELLARGVAAGLSRLEQERAALRARVLFEQFVTPEVARQLDAHPDLLKGREAEVTLLFCDIRGFSSISERLGPAQTVSWIGDVMNVLTECVVAHNGTLVEYIGDELLAMWNAPVEQPDHVTLACRAALDMLARLPELNDRWQSALLAPMSVGIGINTGTARVGNTGSQRKPQYGPLGNTVNLASRVQGATKFLKTPLLITEAARSKLEGDFAVRRLCKVRLQNIAAPIDLHELGLPDNRKWDDLKKRYEQALSAFEAGQFARAVQVLGSLVAEKVDDGPTLMLLSRAIEALHDKPADFDGVWELPGK